MPNAAHHATPAYKQGRAMLNALAAQHNDTAVCWRDGLTLNEHRGAKRWHAGHTIPGSTTWQLWTNVQRQPPAGDWLALEADRCNLQDAARQTNAKLHGYDHGL